jgi:putative oxidoreductase
MVSPDSQVTLRLAREDDAQDIARFSGQLGFPMDREAARGRLRDALGAPDHAMLVAESDGAVVGLIELKRVRLVMARKQVEVVSLVVDERHRGRGIGTRLLEEAERWAHDLRCSKLRVRSDSGRERAHSVYERVGFEPTRTETLFEKQLGPARPKSADYVPTSIASRRASSVRERVRPLSIVRIAVAGLLIANGILRVASGGVAGFGALLSAYHLPFGAALAWGLTAVEIVGGVALAAGRFARPLCLWFAVELIAGIVLVEEGDAWLAAGSGRNGAEYAALLAACLLAVAWGDPRTGRASGALKAASLRRIL